MERHNVDFHVAEYNALRSELQFNIRNALEAVLYSLIANALIVAWIAGLPATEARITNFILIASAMPIVLTVVALTIFRQRIASVFSMAEYCRKLEERFALEGFGWQHFVLATRGATGGLRARHVYMGVFVLQLVLGIYLFQASLRNYLGY